MPLLHFGKRGRLQLVDQVVGLDAKPFAPAYFYIRLFRLLRRELIPHLRGASRRQRHNLVREVNRVLRLFFIPQSSQPFGYPVLPVFSPSVLSVSSALSVFSVLIPAFSSAFYSFHGIIQHPAIFPLVAK